MAGHSRLPMAGLAKLDDDQEDPDTLEKYLMPSDGLPREPETADGMLIMGMAQGDEEVLFQVPPLSARAPPAGGYAYAKLVIGKLKNFDMELSVRRTADGGFVPRVTAGRYIVGGERRLPVNEDLRPDERLLGMQIWLDTRRDTGLNGKECLQYYQNWLVRVWRSSFPEHPIYKSGRCTVNDNKSSGPTDTGQKKRKANAMASKDDPLHTPSKKHKGQKPAYRKKAREGNEYDKGDEELSAGRDDGEDEGDVEVGIASKDEDEKEKEVKQRYQLSTVEAFWTSYEGDGKENLDLNDEKVCQMIGLGFLACSESGEGMDFPPMGVLKAARDEYRKFQAAAESVEHTAAFRTWHLQTTTGTRKPPTVQWFPSLYEVDEANRKKREQKKELQLREDLQWYWNWLLKKGMTEDQLNSIADSARELREDGFGFGL
ncbi:hypothetical protein NU219Hw_g8272t1 [Hortaea werneckii]